ncbi:MAG TPA: FkbM family methyltransferase [Pseudoxanthomonas sp.]|nr:FkbM family methyltransferase [Pseudoxanthomonas sp.]
MDTQLQPQDLGKRLWKTRYGIMASRRADVMAAQSLQLYGEWMEHELDLLSGLVEQGNSVLEFGGDFGAHAIWLAQAVGEKGQVHVVEPRRLEFQQLCANIALNQLLNVYTHLAWLGRDSENVQVSEKLNESPAGDAAPLRSISVDSLNLTNLHLLKVNLPGTLSGILLDAEATLRRCRPTIYARLGQPEQAIAEVRALKQAGYRCWSHLPYRYNRDNFNASDDNQFPGCVSQNVIAVPVETRTDFDRLQEI